MATEKELLQIKHLLDVAENNIRLAKSTLFSSEIGEKARDLTSSDDGKVIEGVFDGENMIGPDKKKYLVPVNYASKSKLIPGDILKLTIVSDGSYLFKQIGPIKRKNVVGELIEVADGKYAIDIEGKKYQVLTASITYYKAVPGDKLTITIPEKGESEWAAVENILDKSE